MTMLTRLYDLVVLETAAQSASGGTGGGGPYDGLLTIGPLILMFAVIYFLMIRPASKQRREHAAMLNALKKDDEVITSGGIVGRIYSLDERIATLEVADKVKIRILRDRIAGRYSPADASAKK